MSSNQRWIMLSFGALALIGVYLMAKIVESVMGIMDLADPLANYIPLADLVGLVTGLIAFIVLMKHQRASEFGLEVIKEIRKVTWPNLVDTRAATLVVIVLVLIVAFILGLFDYIFSTFTNFIYS